jgi:small subunit ribosomal protein S20
MPSIKQQERRVRIAARQRMENLRWRSTAKTLQKRLEQAVADGDQARIEEEHRMLVRWLDKSASHGAIHPNRVARKKAQAARLASGSGSSS